MTAAGKNAKQLPASTWKRTGRFAVQLLATGVIVYALWWLMVFVLATIVPEQTTESLSIEGRCGKRSWPNALRILTWNVGYAGTGAEADFFMDRGRDVLAKNKETVLQHLENMIGFLREHPSDVFLLQEVDSNSRRTYHVNEAEFVNRGLSSYCSAFAINHDVPFIPYPYLQPLGAVRSGLLSLAAYRPTEATRHQLPGSLPWPDSAFHLQRCLLAWRLPRTDGKEWVVVNVHLEAWDTGDIRTKQLAFVRDFAVSEYERGNFVVIGGDWNSVMPGVSLDQFPSKDKPSPHTIKLPEELFAKEWRWAVDNSHPSNRRSNKPYMPGENYLTTIDGFLVSPNVSVKSVETFPLQFRDSDHEPVVIAVIGQ